MFLGAERHLDDEGKEILGQAARNTSSNVQYGNTWSNGQMVGIFLQDKD